MAREIWQDINGYEGRYQVSNQGRIRSFNCVVMMKNGRRHMVAGRILKPFLAAKYFVVSMPDSHYNRGRRNFQVHRLVYEAFIGDIPPKHHIHHKDGNKVNNRIENLESIHHSDHLSRHQGGATVTAGIVATIREKYATGSYTLQGLGDEFGLALVTVHKMVTGKTWADAPGPRTKNGLGHGRSRGSQNGQAILNDDKVRSIRQAYVDGQGSYSDLAVVFGISESLVAEVVSRRAWRHVE